MDVTQIRRKNYEFLFEQFKHAVRAKNPDEKEKGMLRMFAMQVGFSEAYMSHINTGYREIGLKTARQFEKGLRLKHGYMDVLHDDVAPSPAPAMSATQHAQIPVASSSGEQAFVDAAVKLYREDPSAAQSALLSAFAARFTPKSGM